MQLTCDMFNERRTQYNDHNYIYIYYLAPTNFDLNGQPRGKLIEGTQNYTILLNLLNVVSA